MNIDERRQVILNYLMEHESASVNSIISLLDESPATIRRDLTFLEANGVIVRSRGYAKYNQPAIVSNIHITDGKLAVAKAAVQLIPKGATIFMDSGASAVALAQQLTDREDLQIITNSLSVANVLCAGKPSVYMTGGSLEGRQECLVGSDAEHYIQSIRVPLLFLTTTGIRKEQGLVCVTPAQATLKHIMVKSAERVVVLADAQKLATDSIRLFATFDEIDTLIIDEPVDDAAFLQLLAQKRVELIVANQYLSVFPFLTRHWFDVSSANQQHAQNSPFFGSSLSR